MKNANIRYRGTLLRNLRRSRFLASATLLTSLSSIVAPLLPRTAFAQTADPTNPGNSLASLGPSNTGVQEGQTRLGAPETGPNAGAPLATGAVDPATGAFTATIPFALPAARGDVQPSLALVYSSSAPVGVGGLGWSLNLPTIERHNLSGLPQYANDPFRGEPINPAIQDRFTFSGQPLVPVCTVGAGTGSCSPINQRAPEAMPTWATGGWHYYRLEGETGANYRFFWSPDHQTWVVQQPSGATMEFGVPQDNAADTGGVDTDRQATAANAAAGGSGLPAVFRWNLVRSYDVQRLPSSSHPTNIIEYSWAKLPGITGLELVSDLVDIYDTPKVGDTSPAPTSFAHHTHLRYSPFGISYHTKVARERHSHQLQGVDVTSQTYAGGGPREQVRRYVLSYTTVGMQIQLQQVQLDGWCAQGDPTEDPTTYLLPASTTTPACGTGPSNQAWLATTTFTYSSATNSPTFTKLPQVFNARPPTPPTILDVNADSLPDLLDGLPASQNSLDQTVWLNSAASGASLNTWTSGSMTMNSPTLDAAAYAMDPFANNYASGAFPYDGHVNGLWFDANWTAQGPGLTSSSSTGVQYEDLQTLPLKFEKKNQSHLQTIPILPMLL